MEKVTSQLTIVIKGISELGIGLIALGIIAEIVFSQGAIFGSSIVGNLSAIVAAICLLVVVSAAFGSAAGMNVIPNITALVDGFIGSGASLSSIVTLIIVLSILSK
ncbi:MAG: hypothetical protein ACON39_07345 [Coraliomargaritaceae bacterium]